MDKQNKYKSPILRTPRKAGGTFYTFPSATEDIGLNINQRRNKVSLSHYALLNIPVTNTSNKINTNVTDDKNHSTDEEKANERTRNKNLFNLTNIQGHRDYLSQNAQTFTPSQQLGLSLQNYVFNFETILRNDPDYDMSAVYTVSERVFWKWLKETGAIRWIYDNTTNTWVEEPETVVRHNADGSLEREVTGYSRVVQCIGEISAGSSRMDTFGMFNETYVTIPTSYGGTQQFFRVYEDENYKLGTNYYIDPKQVLSGRNRSTDNKHNTHGLDKV